MVNRFPETGKAEHGYAVYTMYALAFKKHNSSRVPAWLYIVIYNVTNRYIVINALCY